MCDDHDAAGCRLRLGVGDDSISGWLKSRKNQVMHWHLPCLDLREPESAMLGCKKWTKSEASAAHFWLLGDVQVKECLT